MQKSPEYDMIEIIAGLFCWRHRREDTQTMIYVTSDIHGDYIHFSQMTENGQEKEREENGYGK